MRLTSPMESDRSNHGRIQTVAFGMRAVPRRCCLCGSLDQVIPERFLLARFSGDARQCSVAFWLHIDSLSGALTPTRATDQRRLRLRPNIQPAAPAGESDARSFFAGSYSGSLGTPPVIRLGSQYWSRNSSGACHRAACPNIVGANQGNTRPAPPLRSF